MSSEPCAPTTIEIDAELMVLVRNLAEAAGVSCSQIVEAALHEFGRARASEAGGRPALRAYFATRIRFAPAYEKLAKS